MDKNQKLKSDFPLIEVVWRDSAVYDGEFDSEWAFEICTFHTSGYLVKETEKEVMIVREYRIRNGEEVRYRGSILIPKENIVSKRII